MPAQWIYTVAVDISLVYLLYNQLSSRRRLSDLDTVIDLGKADDTNAVTPPKFPLDFSATSRSTPRSRLASTRSATRTRTPLEVELSASHGLEKHVLELGSDDDDGAVAPAASPPGVDAVRRPELRKKSWAWPSRAVPPRVPSAAAAVFVTVETSRVCDGGAVGPWDGGEPPRSGLSGGGVERA